MAELSPAYNPPHPQRQHSSHRATIVAVALAATCSSSTAPPPISAATPAVLPGIETFLADVPEALRGKRVGLITNHTGIDSFRTSDIDLIVRHKDLQLVALLAPEHGIPGKLEAGDTVHDETDVKTGVPVYSLYLSEDRGPTDEMLKNVDVLIYDCRKSAGERGHTSRPWRCRWRPRAERASRSWCSTARHDPV